MAQSDGTAASIARSPHGPSSCRALLRQRSKWSNNGQIGLMVKTLHSLRIARSLQPQGPSSRSKMLRKWSKWSKHGQKLLSPHQVRPHRSPIMVLISWSNSGGQTAAVNQLWSNHAGHAALAEELRSDSNDRATAAVKQRWSNGGGQKEAVEPNS